MKVAIVHEWFVDWAGSEQVVEQILACYPDADLFAAADFLPDESRERLLGKKAGTTFIQRMPFAKRGVWRYLPLLPLAIEQLDLSAYDLVISSSHAVAKGVIVGPDQMHVSYVHSPMRYAWDLQHQYLQTSRLDRGVRGALTRIMLHYLRLWDARTANGVDAFAANSGFVARRIWKTYRRDATVIYPPVDVDFFALRESKDDYYLCASRLVPYKRTELVVQAFTDMPQRRLLVVGDGPEGQRLRRMATRNVEFLGHLPRGELREHLQRARALVFAAEEDFGILPVEAQACGTPVIALGRGGVTETVIAPPASAPTGVFFPVARVECIAEAVARFERSEHVFRPENCRAQALRFSAERFRGEFRKLVESTTTDMATPSRDRGSSTHAAAGRGAG